MPQRPFRLRACALVLLLLGAACGRGEPAADAAAPGRNAAVDRRDAARAYLTALRDQDAPGEPLVGIVELRGNDLAAIALRPRDQVEHGFLRREGERWRVALSTRTPNPPLLQSRGVPAGLPADTQRVAALTAALSHIQARPPGTGGWMEVEGIDDGWARLRLTPEPARAGAPSVVIVRAGPAGWRWVTAGALTPERLAELGVPRSLRAPPSAK